VTLLLSFEISWDMRAFLFGLPPRLFLKWNPEKIRQNLLLSPLSIGLAAVTTLHLRRRISPPLAAKLLSYREEKLDALWLQS